MKEISGVNHRSGLEVVIVGAGMIGLSAAYFLQRLGATVMLLERSFVGDCIPNLELKRVLAYCKGTQTGELTERGLMLAEELAGELGYVGSLQDIEGEPYIDDAKSPNGKRAILLSDFARDLAVHCQQAGVRVIEANPVSSLLMKQNVVHGAVTATGSIVADEVVICAGLQSVGLIGAIGLSLQLKAAENQLGASSARQGIPGVFTGKVPLTPTGAPYIGRPVGFDGLYLAIGHDTNPAAAIAVGEMIAEALYRSEDVFALSLGRVDYSANQSSDPLNNAL